MTPTEIVMITDRSGSMSSVADDAIGGFNRFLADQQAMPGSANLTLVLFDDEYLEPHFRVPLAGVPPLTPETYRPRGTTALYDAIGRAVTHLQQSIPAEAKVIVCIITDGYENASKEWTWSSVKQLVDQKTNHGWEFVFVAGNIDAEVAGGQIGIHHTLSFAMMTADTTPLAYQALSQAADSFRRTGAIDQTWAVDPDSRDKSGS